jgi:glycosyltransferase involved in cell wall biosynthesis
MVKASVVIATYNMGHVIVDTLISCLKQDYQNLEIVVYDDCSTDGTKEIVSGHIHVKYFCGENNLGVGGAFNAAIQKATGDVVILMCADDLFCNHSVVSDICEVFRKHPTVGHVSRWYHQFVGNDPTPVRAWRTLDPIIQANNPSGLAFRKEALKTARCSNKMFIETSALVSEVLWIKEGWDYRILKYDTIAARIHQNTSSTPGYWLKRRVSSPIVDWVSIGGSEMLMDYTSFIQIKTGYKMSAVLEEIWNFIRLRPLSLLNPSFWFYALVATITPRQMLRKLPILYRNLIGKRITGQVLRCVTQS